MGSGAGFVSLLWVSLIIRRARRRAAWTPAPAAPWRRRQVQCWMNQPLDHFSPTDHRQFKQRYFEFLDFEQDHVCWIGGALANKFGTAVVSPEHRYYGKSSPFQRLTTENLWFLSSKQALFGLAHFRQHYQETLHSRYNRSSGFDNTWFVFGVSYSGALNAWFRLKFPHLTCGSLASSGVVLSVYNFTDFDKQVGESAGPECKAALQETTRVVDEQLRWEWDSHSVKALFGAQTLKNDDDSIASSTYWQMRQSQHSKLGVLMPYAPL